MLSSPKYVQLVVFNISGSSDDKDCAYNTGDLGFILGGEDPLEKEMASYSSILAQRIPWTVEPGRLQSMESQNLGTAE